MAKSKAKSRGATPAAAQVEKKETVLVLRTCDANLKSHGGFQWPASGAVSAPDWRGSANCGHGLHGLLWGEGEGALLCWDKEAKWLVVEVEKSLVVDLRGKVKFPHGVVVHCGDQKSATEYLAARVGAGKKITGATLAAGYRGTATAGDMGTATAGDRGTATAGYMGTATAGYMGTATAGDRGTATAGDRGTATAGYMGTATAGDRGTAASGDCGVISIRWYDRKTERYRLCIQYVGENGIKPKVKYRVSEVRPGELEEVAETAPVAS